MLNRNTEDSLFNEILFVQLAFIKQQYNKIIFVLILLKITYCLISVKILQCEEIYLRYITDRNFSCKSKYLLDLCEQI